VKFKRSLKSPKIVALERKNSKLLNGFEKHTSNQPFKRFQSIFRHWKKIGDSIIEGKIKKIGN